jgi:vitamin B12 transporter
MKAILGAIPASLSISFLASALAANGVQAQDTPLAAVISTASRGSETVEQSIASAVVIERQEIEISQALDLPDLLRRSVGVELSRSGGPGSQSGVLLRGANANQTLVLVDGVRVSSATTGVAAWEHLPLEQIERIEIVRGPRAALWGSDAIGGVVQIFTRTPTTAELRLSAGSYGDAYGAFSAGHQGQAWQFGAGLARRNREGYSAQNERGFAFDPDDDGYRASDVHVAADWVGDGASVRLRGSSRDAEIEFDQGRSDSRNRFASLQGTLELGRWQTEGLLGWSIDEFVTPAFFSRFDTERQQLDLLARREFGAQQQLTLIAALLDESALNQDLLDGSTVFDEDRQALSAAALYRIDLAAHRLEAALRIDDYDGFGAEWSPRVGWGWQLASAWRLQASASEGFRAPNFNELYFPGFGGQFAGNPALAPERSRGVELRAEWRPDPTWRSAISAYRNDVDDLINFSGENFAAINIDRARLEGIELEGQWRQGDWSLQGSMAWQNPVNLSTGDLLPRRARRNAHVGIDWQARPTWLFGLELDHASERLDFGQRLDSYGLLALRADWRWSAQWRLQLRWDNVTDEDYELASGFNTAGSSVSASLRWQAR